MLIWAMLLCLCQVVPLRHVCHLAPRGSFGISGRRRLEVSAGIETGMAALLGALSWDCDLRVDAVREATTRTRITREGPGAAPSSSVSGSRSSRSWRRPLRRHLQFYRGLSSFEDHWAPRGSFGISGRRCFEDYLAPRGSFGISGGCTQAPRGSSGISGRRCFEDYLAPRGSFGISGWCT